MYQGGIINDPEGLIGLRALGVKLQILGNQNCSLTPPTIRHKKVIVTIVCTPLSAGVGTLSLLPNF